MTNRLLYERLVAATVKWLAKGDYGQAAALRIKWLDWWLNKRATRKTARKAGGK